MKFSVNIEAAKNEDTQCVETITFEVEDGTVIEFKIFDVRQLPEDKDYWEKYRISHRVVRSKDEKQAERILGKFASAATMYHKYDGASSVYNYIDDAREKVMELFLKAYNAEMPNQDHPDTTNSMRQSGLLTKEIFSERPSGNEYDL